MPVSADYRYILGVSLHSLRRIDRRIQAHFTIAALAVVVLCLCCHRSFARETTPEQAQLVVAGWLTTDARPLGTDIGRRIAEIQTFDDASGEPTYYVVRLEPFGSVIVPADDLIEPIIAFAGRESIDLSPRTPLAQLLSADLSARIQQARNDAQTGGLQLLSISDAQQKWHELMSLAESRSQGFVLFSVGSVSDVRVEPLTESKWSQFDRCGQPLYNYYTPNNYPAGCVATAMAQLMRYHRRPVKGIGRVSFAFEVDGRAETDLTKGGDGVGGPYDWNAMPLVPNCAITDEQRRAIGALCFDAGISVETVYEADASGADVLIIDDALTETFAFGNAISGYSRRGEIDAGLIDMVNPDLDAGYPAILGIEGAGGHAVVVDGYGYNAETLYHHLNMGWGGLDDVWYNLPDVKEYDTIKACIYNIFPQGSGEIISGRITNLAGQPIRNATVIAAGPGGPYLAITDAKGVYALAKVPSSSAFTITADKPGYLFEAQAITTGLSRDLRPVSGNRWGIDFVGVFAGDCNGDGQVNLIDFANMAAAWFTATGQPQWNPNADFSSPTDGVVDWEDLSALADNWLCDTR